MRIFVQHIALLREVARRGPSTLLEAGDRAGLHPLVVPIYHCAASDRVIGVLARGAKGDEWSAVETSRAADWTANALRPLGTVRSLLHRLVAEAHHADANGAAELVKLVECADGRDRPPLFAPSDPVLAKLGLRKYLLMRAGAFPDLWAALADEHLARNDATAALVAAERATGLNRGWGCCLLAQSNLAARLGRSDEARDLALAALLEPLDTLGAEISLAHRRAAVPNGLRVVEMRARLEQQRGGGQRPTPGASEPTAAERAARRAAETLDDAVDAGAGWAAVDALALAREFETARMPTLAAVARGEVVALD